MILLTDFVVIVGIIIPIILIILLAKSKNIGLDKTILTIIFCFIFFTSLHAYASIHDLDAMRYISFLFDYNLFWILGPLLWLYVKSLHFDNHGLLQKNTLHFLPSICITLLVFIPKMLTPVFNEVPMAYLEFYQENQLVFILIRNIHFIIYLILSIRLFLNVKQSLHKKWKLSLDAYNWINTLLLGSLALVSIDLGIRSFELFAFELQFDGGYITLFAIVLFMAYLGYYGVNASRFLIPAFRLQKNENAAIVFTLQETKLLEQKINSTLKKDKRYLDETLSLKSLSESIQVSENKLSAFLNNHLNTKFKDYINFYRVEEVKEKLQSTDYDKFTLLAIAYECGFNSKASFYRIFKKHTGYSPSAYKKSVPNT